jgi:hypothetical protein
MNLPLSIITGTTEYIFRKMTEKSIQDCSGCVMLTDGRLDLVVDS